MRRVLCTVGGVRIYSYNAALYAGLVLGIEAALLLAPRLGLDRLPLLVATLLLVATAIVGSRGLYVLEREVSIGGFGAMWQPRHLSRAWHALWRFGEGGASMYGGLLLALALSLVLLPVLGLHFAAFWDASAFTMLLGSTLTRFGCLLNGCCGGRPTQGWLGVPLADYRGRIERRMPVQMLDAAWTTALFALLLTVAVGPQRPMPGVLAASAIGGYALGRIVLEGWRDRPAAARGPHLHRVLSVGLVVGCGLALWVLLQGRPHGA
jgi:phosphatidylglycerol:prolipoprotein diacylglycerol transferase